MDQTIPNQNAVSYNQGNGDVELTCRECNNPFLFTAGEQEYYAARSFRNPSRCQSCRRAAKKQQFEQPERTSFVLHNPTTLPSLSDAQEAKVGVVADSNGIKRYPNARCSSCGGITDKEYVYNPNRGVHHIYCDNCQDKISNKRSRQEDLGFESLNTL